jgi:hypothetical protein
LPPVNLGVRYFRMLVPAIAAILLILYLSATLFVAFCDGFSRQGKLLRILLIVAVPIVGACLALRMVYVAPRVLAPTRSPTPGQSGMDVVQNSAFEGAVEVAKQITRGFHEH